MLNLIIKNKGNLAFFAILLTFLIHQTFYILIGGTQWDEGGTIVNASKQIYKFVLFITDFSNPYFNLDLQPPEYYGPFVHVMVFIPTMFSFIINFFSSLLDPLITVNGSNEIEIALIIRHLMLNIYFCVILIFIFKKLKKMINIRLAIIFTALLLLIPSINGHALFNLTDIPFAIQYFLAAIYYIDSINDPQKKIKDNLIIGFLFGLVLLIRINAIAFLITLTIFELFTNERIKKKLKTGYSYIRIIQKSLYIYSFSILTWFIGTPSAWKNTINWFLGAYKWQFNQPNKIPTILNGNISYSHEQGPLMLSKWFAYKLPLGILIVFIIAVLLTTKIQNSLFNYSLFFLIYVNLAFLVYRPVFYDEIRHFLFLIPFIVFICSKLLDHMNKEKVKINLILTILLFANISYSQTGLGEFKYTYLNEFVDKEKISVECDEFISQAGCGDWQTDYWGFGGKTLVSLSKKYDENIMYFCPPHYTYSYFQEEKNPWKLNNGDFVFDDQFPFQQDRYFYYQSDFLEYLNSTKFKSIEFLSFTYHRPPIDECGLSKLDKNRFDIKCEVIDGVTRHLRSQEIKMNYLSKCTIKKV